MIQMIIIIILKSNSVGQSKTKTWLLVDAWFNPSQCKNKNDYYYILKRDSGSTRGKTQVTYWKGQLWLT